MESFYHIREISNFARNIIYLGGSTCGMYKDDSITFNILCIKGPSKKFIVCAMDRIATLKCHDVFSKW